MKKSYLTLLLFIATSIFGAVLSNTNNPQESGVLQIHAYHYHDRNQSCVVVSIVGKAVGTHDDGGGKDRVQFRIYDDGKLKATKEISLALGRSQEFNTTLVYFGNYDTDSPGIAIEAQEFGIYIDPFIPQEINGSCKKVVAPQIIKSELRNICATLRRIGVSCY